VNPKTKIVTIKGTRYQVGRLPADKGSFILAWLLTAVREASQRQSQQEQQPPRDIPPGPEIKGEDMVRAYALAAIFNGRNFERHSFVQKECLALCSRMEGQGAQEIPMPITNANGTMSTILDDISLVLKLQMETLVFNFSDFFDQGGLDNLMGIEDTEKSSAATL
jgi:hypothetical protein